MVTSDSFEVGQPGSGVDVGGRFGSGSAAVARFAGAGGKDSPGPSGVVPHITPIRWVGSFPKKSITIQPNFRWVTVPVTLTVISVGVMPSTLALRPFSKIQVGSVDSNPSSDARNG